MIVGQEKICNLIDNSTLDTFPRSLMLVGMKGSGKHLICEYISKKFNLRVLNITETLDQDTIEEIYNRVEPYLYIVEVDQISVKDENTILKFLEEPLKNSYIVLLTEAPMNLLETIVNRCQVWNLQNYSRSYLETFVTDKNDLILEIARTPGQIKQFQNCPLSDVLQLVDKIIDKIDVASLPNTLTIASKFNFKNETSKFDVAIFVDILIERIREKCISSADPRYYSAYFLTAELKKNLAVKNYDPKSLIEKFLIELRSVMMNNHRDLGGKRE